VIIEDIQFYGLYAPGIRSLAEQPRIEAIGQLLRERPEIADLLEAAKARAEAARQYLRQEETFRIPGFPDLYKFFCARYRALLRDDGRLGVVLPRSAFVTEGSAGFREWLFQRTTCHRLDFLLNTGRWAFDSEPRYTVALVASEA